MGRSNGTSIWEEEDTVSPRDRHGPIMASNQNDHSKKMIKIEVFLILHQNLEEHLAKCPCSVDAQYILIELIWQPTNDECGGDTCIESSL